MTVVAQGLTSLEAARRLEQIGPNSIVERRVSPVVRIARRFWEPVPWMLEAAVILQLAIGERLEAVTIAVVLVFNVALGVFQDGRAGEALAALKSKLALTAFARRDGRWIEVPAAALVPGDIVRLGLGGVVPADALILEGSVLLDQSMLTGESIAAEIGAGKVAYASALVRRGAATAQVTATGQRTYFGKTAELVRIAHAESGEQRAVLGIVRNLAAFNGAVVVLLVMYAHTIAMPVDHIIPLVLTALLASVPVALPASFTLAAALSAQALTRRGILLTRLSAIHAAATVDVLCVDKTGTLTRNSQSVTVVRSMSSSHTGPDVLASAALASSESGEDPVDRAIRAEALAQGSAILKRRVLRFTPFDPATKTSEALVADELGHEERILKGAPGAIAAIAPLAYREDSPENRTFVVFTHSTAPRRV